MLMLISTTLLLVSTAVFAAKVIKVNKIIPLIDISTIEVINHRGEISFKGIDTDRLTIKGSLDEQATELKLTRRGSRLIVEVKVPEQLAPKKGSKLEISLPTAIAIEAKGVNSKWKFKHTFSVQIESVRGNIKLTDVSGNVFIDVVNSDMDIENIRGNLKINSLSGKIKLVEIAGNVEVGSIEGNIDYLQKVIHKAQFSNVKGAITVRGQLGADAILNVNTIEGDIRLDVGSSESFHSTVNVLGNGKIINQLPEKGESSALEKGANLNLSRGYGSARIDANTLNGTVYLLKKQ